MKTLMFSFAIGLMAISFGSTCLAGGAISVQWDDAGKPTEAPVYKKKGGPLPHAPAHGDRAEHQYRYYPCCSVYHEPSQGLYFYRKGNGWAVGASLPTDMMSNLAASVSLDLDTDKPYEHHAEHVKQCPKENYKPVKMEKNSHYTHSAGGRRGHPPLPFVFLLKHPGYIKFFSWLFPPLFQLTGH